MASELRVDTLKDSSGNNSVGMSYVAGGSAKAWSTMDSDASTISFLDSFNSSSAQDNGAGKYGTNWTSNLANVNYYSCGVTCYQNTTTEYQIISLIRVWRG